MSNPNPPLRLDYAPPQPSYTGTLVWTAILWSVLTPILATGLYCFFGILSQDSVPFFLIAWPATTLGLLAFGLKLLRQVEDAGRRRARTTGALLGIGVGLLLVGGCFVALAGPH